MTSAATPLSVARDARGVVTLTLNDPARFNALGSEMLTALQQALAVLPALKRSDKNHVDVRRLRQRR